MRDYPKGFVVCFHYNQTSHRKVECPQLLQGSVQGFASTATRATESRPVKVEVPRVRRRAFQLTAEEVCASPDAMAGMYSLFYSILSYIVLTFLYA